MEFNEIEMRIDLENNSDDYTTEEIDFIIDAIKSRIKNRNGTDYEIISYVLENFTTLMKKAV